MNFLTGQDDSFQIANQPISVRHFFLPYNKQICKIHKLRRSIYFPFFLQHFATGLHKFLNIRCSFQFPACANKFNWFKSFSNRELVRSNLIKIEANLPHSPSSVLALQSTYSSVL